MQQTFYHSKKNKKKTPYRGIVTLLKYLLQSFFIPFPSCSECRWILFLFKIHCHKLLKGQGTGRCISELEESLAQRRLVDFHYSDNISWRSVEFVETSCYEESCKGKWTCLVLSWHFVFLFVSMDNSLHRLRPVG